MKTTLSLLAIAVLVGCASHRSGQPTTASANKNDSFTPTSAAELNVPSGESRQQAQESERWDQNDDRNVADRMLERVKQEGATRIASVHPSRDKYLFVAEVDGDRKGRSGQDSRPKTDMWLVNKNGSGLRRLTYDGASYSPEWSPSGDEIAFVNRKYNLPTLEIMETESGSDSATTISWGLCESCEFEELRWAPNGQAVAALDNDGTTLWIRVILPGVGEWSFRDYRVRDIHNLTRGARAYRWSKDGDLILDYGRFTFDWEKVLSYVNRKRDEASHSESDEAVIAQAREADTQRAAARAADRFLKIFG